ncbi:hypothetical protein JCM8547_000631 [Rhodosporidiobolus lusitaniae]
MDAAPPADRSALLASAVSFLRDPSTSSSPLAQRISFLESKGLTQPEIQSALAQASSAPAPYAPGPPVPRGGAPYGGYGGQPFPGVREYEKDWRDWFIMGVVGGGVGWLAVKLAQKYLLPSLQPPSETDLEASQRALEAKYDEAAELLKTLQESTDAVAASLDEQKENVEKELAEVRKAVEEMREGEKKRDEWAKKVEQQVEDMAKGLPALLDKQTSSQTSSLADLQAELKSLKSLLIARRPTPGSPSLSSSSISGSSSIPSASAPSSNLPFAIKPPGLPAWQMKGASTSTTSTPAPSSSSSSSSTATPTPSGAPQTWSSGGYSVPDAASSSGAGEKKEDPSASGVLVEKPASEAEGDKKEDEGK